MPIEAASAANGHASTAGHSTPSAASTSSNAAMPSCGPMAVSAISRRSVSAALTVLAMRSAPAAARPELPPLGRGRGGRAWLLCTRWPLR
jgi:hypothetical protein